MLNNIHEPGWELIELADEEMYKESSQGKKLCNRGQPIQFFSLACTVMRIHYLDITFSLKKIFINPFSPSHSLLYFYMKLKKNMIQSHIHTRFELTSIGFLKGLLQAKLSIGESEICNQALRGNKTCSSEDFWGRNLDNWNEAIKNNMEHEGNKLKSLSHNEVVLTNMNKMHANANICF